MNFRFDDLLDNENVLLTFDLLGLSKTVIPALFSLSPSIIVVWVIYIHNFSSWCNLIGLFQGFTMERLNSRIFVPIMDPKFARVLLCEVLSLFQDNH